MKIFRSTCFCLSAHIFKCLVIDINAIRGHYCTPPPTKKMYFFRANNLPKPWKLYTSLTELIIPRYNLSLTGNGNIPCFAKKPLPICVTLLAE